jgi:hypothetical protein
VTKQWRIARRTVVSVVVPVAANVKDDVFEPNILTKNIMLLSKCGI